MSLAGQGKRNPPSFGSAGKLNKEDTPKVEVKPEEKEVVTVESTDSMEALRKKHEAKLKQKAADNRKKQVSTYLEPAVYKKFSKFGSNKGDKADLINDLLKEFFGIED